MHLFQLGQLAAFAVAAQAAATAGTALQCKELVIPVDASAKNFKLPSNLTVDQISVDYIKSLGLNPNATVSGKYNIGARYCEPLKAVASRQNTLQILIHGITYTRDYWSGLAAPGKLPLPNQDTYSWILYAAQQGYPTLSIDRLCNGLSSHPDGISACQVPLQSETVHGLITMARAGKLPGPEKPRAFNKVIVAGHSDGSIVANYLSLTHPSDADALLLTGFSYNVTNGFAGVGNSGPEPAAKADPDRFGNLPPSYITFTNRTAFEGFFFFGDYSVALVDYNFKQIGTVTIGEFVSILLGQQAAPSYRGKVFVLDGEEDIPFCSASSADAAASKPGMCSAGFETAVKSFYPGNSGFGYYSTARTGHCLNLHLTAQRSYNAAFQFLAKSGF